MSSNFDALEAIKEDKIQEMVEASENSEKTIQQLLHQHQQRVRDLEQKYWERCRFCSCGADSIFGCSCDKEKRAEYMKRTSRKINNELGNQALTISMLATEYNVQLDSSEGEVKGFEQ